ncbi:ABC transporter ATP-binding protein [Paenibacillus paeoniae]|uniref:ABC transporter ATP-binding protein n=1 Tax=Paenibacillus paeoniae TaxID=2292705 RepID=A0A371PEZ2_9BACL|nr:ABC transporter ATP-binding protein [Paenibacillus paeoniae]REK74511.1 ABC transporter ATP-binding protein [Paenibacillus paeoniae]
MLKQLRDPFRYEPPESLGRGRGEGKTGKKRPSKAKDTTGTLKRLWRYLAHHRIRMSAVFVMIVLSTVLSLLGPYLAGTAIDQFIEKRNSGFIPFLIGMAVVYGLYACTMWLQNIWMIGVAQETVRAMRQDLFAHLHKLPIPFFAKRQHGELMSRVTNDIENVSSSLNSSFIQLVSSVLLLVGVVGVMLSLSPLLTLLTFMVIPLMVIGMKWITNRTSRLFKEQQRNLGDLNGFVEETLSGQRIIKAFSRETIVIEAFNERNKRIHSSGFWAQAISGFIPKLMNGLNNLSFALIVGVGSLLVIHGHGVTVGTILIFAEFSRQFTRPLNDLANQWNTMLSAMAGAERVFHIIDEPIEAADEQEAIALGTMKGHVAFHNVSFAYQDGHPILHHISFEATPGETIAFVGPTGAGKSTIIGLLCRFYEPSSGLIRMDGRPARSIRRDNLRSHMAFVLQDPFLFEGTIRENIRYGKLDASDEEVEEAAKQANAHSFIMRLKGGYGAKLKPDGGGISQGQKQLIAIARAILADPTILVLDEATSSIDTVTEIKIQEALQRLMKGRTSFVIAHRLNTIQTADRIIVLQDGEVTESGTHDELLLQDGFYSKLVNGQVVLT